MWDDIQVQLIQFYLPSRKQTLSHLGKNKFIFKKCYVTPRKINMEPENTPLEVRKIIWTKPSWLQVRAVNLPGCSSWEEKNPLRPELLQGPAVAAPPELVRKAIQAVFALILSLLKLDADASGRSGRANDVATTTLEGGMVGTRNLVWIFKLGLQMTFWPIWVEWHGSKMGRFHHYTK